MIKQQNQSGFTAVELLITLFVAVAFLVGGYQLYSLIIKDGGQTRSQSRASNVAYNYLRQYATSATNPCTPSLSPTVLKPTVTGLTAVTATITISCPYAGTSGTNTASSIALVTVTVTYNSPQATVQYATYTRSQGSGSQSDLIAWWPLDGSLVDASGYGTTMAADGAYYVAGAGGASSNSEQLVEPSRWMRAPVQGLPNPAIYKTMSSGFTYSLWIFKNNNTTTNQWPLVMGSPDTHTNYGMRLFSYGASMVFEYGLSPYNGTNWSAVTIQSAMPTAHWDLATVTYDGTTLRTYWNGVQQNSQSPVALNPTFDQLQFGGLNDSNAITAALDDIRVYSRALTADQVMELKNAGAQ